MNIALFMTKKIVTVEMDDTLSDLKIIFDNVKFHQVLVVDSNKSLVGVVSDRAYFKAISPNIGLLSETSKDIASLNKRVHQIMKRDLTVLTINDYLIDAIDVFNKLSVSCIPIINDDRKPVGIVTWRDILKIFKKADHQ